MGGAGLSIGLEAPQRIIRLGVLALSVATIATLTLLPVETSPTWAPGGCCLTTDLILNVLLFAPLGLGLALNGVRLMPAIVTGLLTSAAVESAQLWIPGRFASLSDLLTNTAGTLLGAILWTKWPTRQRWWRKLGPLAAALIVGTGVLAGFLVRPASPSPQTWWGQWAHQFGGSARFTGRVLMLSLQGIPIRDGPLARSAELNRLLRDAGVVRLGVKLVSGRPVAGRAQLAGLVAGGPGGRGQGGGGEYLGLWQEGRSLIGFVRLGLTDASLRTAWLRLDDALPESQGDTIEVSATITAKRVELGSTHGAQVRKASLRLEQGVFWSGLLPFEPKTSGGKTFWSVVSTAAAFAGLGMGIRRRGALALVLAVALMAGPALAGSAFPNWITVAAALGGSGIGRTLAHSLRVWG